MSDESELPQTEILDASLPQTEILPDRVPTELLPDRVPTQILPDRAPSLRGTAADALSGEPRITTPLPIVTRGDGSDTSGNGREPVEHGGSPSTPPPAGNEETATAILDDPQQTWSASRPGRTISRSTGAPPAITPSRSSPPTTSSHPSRPTAPPRRSAAWQPMSGHEPQRPAVDASGPWHAYWQRVNQPWRIMPEIPELRQLALRRCLAAVPDIEHGDYPFQDVEPWLAREDIEWLLANHESGGGHGPVDWSKEDQRARRGLDLRGADLRGLDLSRLPLARTRFGLSHAEWVRATPEQREQAAALLHDVNLEGAQLEHATLIGAHLVHTRCVGAIFEGADLRNAHFTNADCLEARFAEADLRGADLAETDCWKATLDRADLSQARLPHAVLREASLEHANLTQAQLQNADCIKAHLHHAVLAQADLTGADLHRAQMPHTDLTGAVLTGAVLTHAQLTSADFSQATMERVQLDEAQLAGATLSGTRLAHANLHKAQLVGANLSQAILREADLSQTQLRGANLSQTDLTRASLRQTQARSADFARAQLDEADLTEGQFPEASFDHAILRKARLARAELVAARMPRAQLSAADLSEANLAGCDLRRAIFDPETDLFGAHLAGDAGGRQASISVADLRWGDANLTVVEWSQLRLLGDERTARAFRHADGKPKDTPTRLADFEAAVRASRQLAAVLRQQGLSHHADRFSYRAQALQRQVLLRRRAIPTYIGSQFLNLLAGYGYRPWRALIFYVLLVLAFAAAYLGIGSASGAPLAPIDAVVFSMLAFHGRGFVPGATLTLHHPLAILAAVEALAGLVVEVGLIATFAQRFFGK